MSRTRALFPTLLYQAPLGGPAAFLRDILAECLRVRANDAEGRAWSKKHYPGGFTSYGSLCRLHRSFSTFMQLEKLLDRHVRVFARRLKWEVDVRRLKMTDCWVNVMPRGVAHSLHLHPESVVSGTYYVKVPPGSPGLKLEDPRLDRFMATPSRPDLHVTLPAKAGSVLLFESWLRHEVAPNPVAAERVSVSFNYSVPG